LPVPHIPQLLGTPEHDGPSPLPPATDAAKVENFFFKCFDPQAGQVVEPSQAEVRTRISLSFPQSSH
jgi:hypothetical protein